MLGRGLRGSVLHRFQFDGHSFPCGIVPWSHYIVLDETLYLPEGNAVLGPWHSASHTGSALG